MRLARILAVAAFTLLLAGPAVLADGGGGAPSDSANKPKHPSFIAGERAVKAKEYARAIPLLEVAANDDIRDVEAANLLGYSLRQLGHREAALSYYFRALRVDPAHKGANEYLGELYVEMNDLPKAEFHLTRLQQICGGSACPEYRDLKAAIDKAKTPRSGS